MQDNFFFREPSTKKKMLDILFIYSKLNPDTGYRQGMHEILAPILWVVEVDAVDSTPSASEHEAEQTQTQAQTHDATRNETQTQTETENVGLMRNALDPEYAEHDSFNLFCAVMQTTKSFYEMGQTKDSSPIVARCRRIHEEILQTIDPDLANHLQVIGVLPQVYLM
jgi:TBC1 domain family member 5